MRLFFVQKIDIRFPDPVVELRTNIPWIRRLIAEGDVKGQAAQQQHG
jgi:hypothetical protein